MVKTIDLKFKDFQKALKSLDEVMRMEKNNVVRDSVVKRFEYTFELCWKTGKLVLGEKFGVEIYSPKECFRELLRNKVISEESANEFIKMTNDRNDIVHAYAEELSEMIYENNKEKYFALFTEIEKIFAQLIN